MAEQITESFGRAKVKRAGIAAGTIRRGRWREVYPGFLLPGDWQVDSTRWPDFTDANFLDKAGGEALGVVEGEDGEIIARRPKLLGVDPRDVIRLRGLTQPDKRAWGAWLKAEQEDLPLKRGWPDLEHIADMRYSTARFKYLTPLWRQQILKIVTELDDVEDQLSTVLWIVGWISKKWIPKPLLKGLDKARDVNDALDCAGKSIAGLGPSRGGKSDYIECVAARKRRAKKLLEQKKGLLAWLRNNWGQLLEAAQASGTWTDVGIVLGPIMNVVEDGWWGAFNTAMNTPSVLLDIFEEPPRDITQEAQRRIYAPDAIERAGPNYIIRGALDRARNHLTEVFLEPLGKVDWESLEVGPFDF